MKLTVITEADGTIYATQQGEARSSDGLQVSLVTKPGTKKYEIDVPDDLAGTKDVKQLHERVQAYLPKG
jgi:hypothetical protein